jgi:hypothetical protein
MYVTPLPPNTIGMERNVAELLLHQWDEGMALDHGDREHVSYLSVDVTVEHDAESLP